MADDGSREWLVKLAPFGIDGRSIAKQFSCHFLIAILQCQMQRSPFLLLGVYVDSSGKHSLYQGLVSIFDGHEKYLVVELCAPIEENFCGSCFASESCAMEWRAVESALMIQ